MARSPSSLTHIRLKFLLLSLAILSLQAPLALAQKAGDEIPFPPESFKKLDTFEALNLEDADKLYNKGDFKGAFAAYKAYSFEFAKSKAMPYVLLRMGRCLHKLEKRNAAIKAYEDVVNYFPDDVRYAAGALYYIGECHGQNGDEEKRTAIWARLVKDDDYVTQANSGTALAHLGAAMQKLGKFEEATEYQWRTAVAFLSSNPNAAKAAREAVLYHYAVRQPNHDKLKEFYVAASGFDGQGKNIKDPENDTRYWSAILNTALDSKEKEKREAACAYWTAKIGTRFGESDHLRKQWCDAQLVHEKNPKNWLDRMAKLYAAKPASLDRIMTWCGYYKDDAKFRSAFFEKEAQSFLGGLKFDDRMKLMDQLRGKQMDAEAQAVMRGLDTKGLSDTELIRYVSFAAGYESEEVILRHLARMKDPLEATKARYDYYKARSHKNPPNMEKALAQIPELRKSPKYAGAQLSWDEATLLDGLRRYEEAIKAYRAANRQPDTTWAVADCLVALKQYPEAIKTLREIESVGGGVAAQASLKIAGVHRASGDKAREVDQLRAVLKRYPKHPQSSEAHRILEGYGVALIGGEAEAEE